MVEVPSSNLGSPTKQKTPATAGVFCLGRHPDENWRSTNCASNLQRGAPAPKPRRGHNSPKAVVIHLGSPTKQKTPATAGVFCLGRHPDENWRSTNCASNLQRGAPAPKPRRGHNSPKAVVIHLGSPTKQKTPATAGVFCCGQDQKINASVGTVMISMSMITSRFSSLKSPSTSLSTSRRAPVMVWLSFSNWL